MRDASLYLEDVHPNIFALNSVCDIVYAESEYLGEEHITMEPISVVFGIACATVIPDIHNKLLIPGLRKAVDAASKKAQIAFGNNPYAIETQDELQKIFIQALSQATKSYCTDIKQLC